MSGSETGAAPTAERRAWLGDLRRVDERQEDDLAGNFDAQWGEIEPMHHAFVVRFLSSDDYGSSVEREPAGQVLASRSAECWEHQ